MTVVDCNFFNNNSRRGQGKRCKMNEKLAEQKANVTRAT